MLWNRFDLFREEGALLYTFRRGTKVIAKTNALFKNIKREHFESLLTLFQLSFPELKGELTPALSHNIILCRSLFSSEKCFVKKNSPQVCQQYHISLILTGPDPSFISMSSLRKAVKYCYVTPSSTALARCCQRTLRWHS